MEKIIVLSDVHFGIKECKLNGSLNGKELKKGKANVDKFFEAIKPLGDIQEFIFLGDIFDLHLSNFFNVTKSSRYFFSNLKKLKSVKKITYIPGNHDHAFWLYHIVWNDIIKKLRRSMPLDREIKVTNKVFKNNDSFLYKLFRNDIDFAVTYPFEKRYINNKLYLFFHGQFIDKLHAKYLSLITLFLPDIKKRDTNIDQLEIFSSPLYELFNLIAQTQIGRTGLRKRYDQFSFIFKRDENIDYFKKKVEEHIKQYAGQSNSNNAIDVLDYAIFGHTHCAGVGTKKYKRNKKLVKINSGCWARDDNILGEFIFISPEEKHPQLFYLTESQPSCLYHKDTIDLNNGTIPK